MVFGPLVSGELDWSQIRRRNVWAVMVVVVAAFLKHEYDQGQHPYIFWESTLSLDVKFQRENVLHSWELLESLGYKHFRVLESGISEECCSVDELKSHNLDVDILSVHTSNIEYFFDVVHYS